MHTRPRRVGEPTLPYLALVCAAAPLLTDSVCMYVRMQELGGPCQEKMAEGGAMEALMGTLLRGANLPSETAAW